MLKKPSNFCVFLNNAYGSSDWPLRLHFFSSDRGEPARIHVKRDRQLAKFWLSPVSLAKNRGFKDHELNDMARLVEDHEQQLLEVWHDYFGA